MTKEVRIITFDGGGIDGLFEATILQELERRLNGPIRDHVHMIAGVSIGSIIAAATCHPTNPMTGEEIVDCLIDDGPKIFANTSDKHWTDRLTDAVTKNELARILNGRGYLYDAEPLEECLEKLFGDTWLSEIKDIDFLATAYNTETEAPEVFRSWDAQRAGPNALDHLAARDVDYRIKDLTRASASPPTFFIPHLAPNRSGQSKSLIDGGVISSNPTMRALTEAWELYPDADSYVVISFGASARSLQMTHEKIVKYRRLTWGKTMPHVFVKSAREETCHHVGKWMKREGLEDQYFRIMPPEWTQELSEILPSFEMDDTTPDNMAKILNMASRFIHQNPELLDGIVDALSKPMSSRADLGYRFPQHEPHRSFKQRRRNANAGQAHASHTPQGGQAPQASQASQGKQRFRRKPQLVDRHGQSAKSPAKRFKRHGLSFGPR